VTTPLKVHRKVEAFPPMIRKLAARMITDDIWPPDFQRPGLPTYADVGRFLRDRGVQISKSAIGRWGRKLLQAKYGRVGR
jgi:hypothetical protein